MIKQKETCKTRQFESSDSKSIEDDKSSLKSKDSTIAVSIETSIATIFTTTIFAVTSSFNTQKLCWWKKPHSDNDAALNRVVIILEKMMNKDDGKIDCLTICLDQ